MNSSTCGDPRIAEQLLDLAQFAHRRALGKPVQLSSEQSWHLEGCTSCRGSIERARRLVAVHLSLRPSTAETAAARARLAGRGEQVRSNPRFGRRLPRAIAAALVLALAAGAAAQLAARRRVSSRVPVGAPPALARVPQGAPIVGPRLEPALQPSGVSGPVTPSSPAHARVERPVHAVGRSLDRAASAADSAVAAIPAPDGEGAAGLWEAVSRALRVRDHAAAESALDRLITSDDAHTRDAARLARAQLWLSWGRGFPARAELEDLAATGATPVIRARARETLEAHP